MQEKCLPACPAWLHSSLLPCNGMDIGPLAAALPSVSLTQLSLPDATPDIFAALTSQTGLATSAAGC